VTIERGQDWGRRADRPSDLVEVASDAEAGALVTRLRRADHPVPTLGLLAGDLRRTLGRADRVARLEREVSEFTVDLGVVVFGGEEHWFVSHVVVRRSWWRGEVVAAMNAQFLGPWDVAPRGHPNDGRLDLVRVRDMGIGDRWKAWRRLPSGTHLPHPGIELTAVSANNGVELALSRSLRVRVDGTDVGSAERLVLRVEPDALTVCI
jgi:putative lipid kinase YegS-like protein